MAKHPKPLVAEQVELSSGDLAKMGAMCAWADCEAAFDGKMPNGWRWMLVYWWAYPASNHKMGKVAMSENCDRDAALCPEHALYLESQLKPIVRWPHADASGTA